jgi:hypothetical protein
MSYDENKPWALHAVIIKKSVPKEDALRHAENIIKKKEFKARETKLTWRFRALPKTKFKKEKFRSKKVNKDITLVFGELLPEHAKLSGRGFFDFFKKGYESAKETLGNLVDTTTDYFKPRLDSYDNKTASMMKQIGNLPITRLQIYKAPLREMFNKALDLVSLGAWSKSKKKYGFDTFFHLGLLATLDNGQTYIIEKLDRPSVSQDFNLNEEGLEVLDVPLTGLGAKRLTINNLLEDARKAVGDQKFFEYDSFRNNCQFFVRMLLDNQGLYTEREKNFFFQDISQLVNELPEYVQNFQRFATDTTATFGKITGQGVGRGVEDFVKEKGLEVASDFADSLGGQDFFKGVQEDITDVFSGRQVGDTARQRTADREAQQKADQLAYEAKEREYRKTKEFEAETYARDIGGKFYNEIWPNWKKKFMTENDGYLLYPEDVVHFGRTVRDKGLRSKAEVDKFFAKTKKDALQMLKTGKPVGNIKYDPEMLRKYQSQLKGSGNPFIDLGNKAVEKSGRGSTCVGKMCMTEEEEEEEARRAQEEEFRGQEDVELQGIEDAVSEGRIPRDLAGIIMGYIPTAGEAYIQQLLQHFGEAYTQRYYNASEEEQIRMIVKMEEALERHPPSNPIRPSTEVVQTRFPQPRVLPSRDDEDDEKKQGDGKPSRGYYFIRALNASKAPKNSQKASIVEWRKNNKENAERINQSKFRKFDYSKLPKGSENNALRTKNPNPVGRHPVYEPTEFDLSTKRNYGGLYALKKQEKKEEKKYFTLEDLDEDEYILALVTRSKDEFLVVGNQNEERWDEKGYIKLSEPRKGWLSIKTLGDFDVDGSSDGKEGTGYYIVQLVLTRKKKEKKPKKAPQQNPEEKEEADFKEERPAPPPPEPTIDELARGHYEADKELRKAIKKRAEERFGKAEFNTALVRVRKQMQRERDKEQGVARKFK